MEQLRKADPTVVGRYRTVGRLGAGGMGVVYLAEGPRGTVALKLVRAELGDDLSFRARFRREVQACFRVSSGHTAKLIDFDTEAERPWMATEFVEGRSLDVLVAADGPLTHADQLALATGLAQALVAIHEEDVVHRDLKPANVLMTAAGPKVIDFGIAAAADAARITSSGLMVGSPGWLAPEQIELGEATAASDIFALALVLCFAASGAEPFGTGSTDALLFRAMNGPPSVPLEQLARPLHRVVLAAISKDPARRPTAGQLLEHLSEAGVGGATPAPPVMIGRGNQETLRTSLPLPPESAPSPYQPTPPPYQPPYQPTPPPYQPPQPPYQPAYQPTPPPGSWPPAGPTPKRKRPGWVIPVAAVAALAVAGGAVGLILSLGGSDPTPTPSASPSAGATTPAPGPSTRGAITTAEQSSLASAALVQSGDFVTPVESIDRKAISMPCNLPDEAVPATAVLKGIRTTTAGNTGGNYVSETVVVLPTSAQAATIFADAQQQIADCQQYPSTFQNQTDTVTIVSGPSPAGAGDDSVYVAERYTPQNYKGPTTSTGTVIIRRGPVIIRLFAEYANQENRTKTTALAKVLVARVDAAS